LGGAGVGAAATAARGKIGPDLAGWVLGGGWNCLRLVSWAVFVLEEESSPFLKKRTKKLFSVLAFYGVGREV
jgi:hypothetical protein